MSTCRLYLLVCVTRDRGKDATVSVNLASSVARFAALNSGKLAYHIQFSPSIKIQ